ncbi:DNA-binding response regulator [Paenibacillus sp. CAA11]|uniref:response regulator transcription factor n=1 Tax=Paenibacillus sp. CAA11 TaxID=1532905 RepID=UPI000D3905C6|nr:response regulator transcription factor [Paenibacillus sp. CAA11]AWB44481.1 DNA-binding response regulator [Paenibacillus sp. CAA11]
MNILLAEDDVRLGELIVHMLKKKAGYHTDWVTTGNEALEQAFSAAYQLLILDWMMPDGDGVFVCKELRKEGYMGAILMLTARDTLSDRIEGLDAGADDYLVKPFELDELLARIRALSRRNYAPIQEEEVHLGEGLLSRNHQKILFSQGEVQLTPREFQLLDLLIRNKGLVLSREVILERIWGLEAEVNMKTIDATVKLLRKKLSPFEHEDIIESVRGVGYKLEI